VPPGDVGPLAADLVDSFLGLGGAPANCPSDAPIDTGPSPAGPDGVATGPLAGVPVNPVDTVSLGSVPVDGGGMQPVPVNDPAAPVTPDPIADPAAPIGTGTDPAGAVDTADPPPAEPPPAASAPGSGIRILLINPKVTGNIVRYQIDSFPFEMPADYHQDLDGKARLIEFDRGGGFGQARYTLTEGTYAFTLGDRGWDLVQQTFQVTVDNSANSAPFYLNLAGGEEVVFGPGETRALTGRFPIDVTFDRGDGGEPLSRRLDAGTYRVGVDPATNLLDLFPAATDPPDSAGPTDAPAAAGS
jgi:hypothetical protein